MQHSEGIQSASLDASTRLLSNLISMLEKKEKKEKKLSLLDLGEFL